MDLLLWERTWVLLWILTACRGQTEEDEKRPYKFAFAIEGYQHRSEEKDERGIIMGEYGFVTGDGVYHVTVYATDENGNFKIIKMKNYYIGLPGEGTTAAPSRTPPPPPTTRATTSIPPTTKSPILTHLEGLMGCSGCIVPIKNKNGSPGSVYGEGLLDERLGGGGNGGTGSGNSLSGGRPATSVPLGGSKGKPFGGGASSMNPEVGGGLSGFPGIGGGGSGANPGTVNSNRVGGIGGGSSVNPGIGGSGSGLGGNGGGRGGGGSSAYPGGGAYGSGGDSIIRGGGGRGGEGGVSKDPRPSGGGQFGKPGASAEGPVSTPNYSNGRPPEIDDLMALLYRFNYTLKYHGHHESGYRNGEKEGGYFFNGRDGFGRNVEYIANEFGFQPNITLVDLGLKAPDTPQGENEENELRGSEFKWFYKK